MTIGLGRFDRRTRIVSGPITDLLCPLATWSKVAYEANGSVRSSGAEAGWKVSTRN